MTTERYDAIVVGLGAMGSAATYQLAKAGANVLGLDRYHPPHDRGSTHGETRITRIAIGEGSHYVPLVKRSHELWREIERESGESIFTQCGMLLIAGERAVALHGAHDFLATTVAAAREHGVEHELLTPEQAARRFPQFALTGTERGAYYEPGAGYLRPERAVAAQLRLAEGHGARLRFGERVTEVGPRHAATGAARWEADTVVVAAGPWVGELVARPFAVHRQVQAWFETTAYEAHRDMPIYIWEQGGGPDDFVYGFPAIDGPDGGVKVASEDYSSTTTPDACDRTVAPEETRALHARVDGRVRGVGPRTLRASTCLYTMTPDREFLIEAAADGVLLVSACSGHGFKHSAAIGERVARRVLAGG
ncbi:MAG TPA: N-methyl-L-tryptophan oxidase [Solirubrobacteraceae bacterium]|nr:N-methyl-L-tryptophan oxidase [Solirubrobacteraceae bacterium]